MNNTGEHYVFEMEYFHVKNSLSKKHHGEKAAPMINST